MHVMDRRLQWHHHNKITKTNSGYFAINLFLWCDISRAPISKYIFIQQRATCSTHQEEGAHHMRIRTFQECSLRRMERVRRPRGYTLRIDTQGGTILVNKEMHVCTTLLILDIQLKWDYRTT